MTFDCIIFDLASRHVRVHARRRRWFYLDLRAHDFASDHAQVSLPSGAWLLSAFVRGGACPGLLHLIVGSGVERILILVGASSTPLVHTYGLVHSDRYGYGLRWLLLRLNGALSIRRHDSLPDRSETILLKGTVRVLASSYA